MSQRSVSLLMALLWLTLTSSVMATDKWLYVSRNLQIDDSVDQLDTLMQRASAAGYNKLLLADSKFSRLGTVIDRYFVNVKKVQASAKRHHIEIVPTIFSIGYSNDLLFHNPNLAEALPVRGMPLRMEADGDAILQVDNPPRLPVGDESRSQRGQSAPADHCQSAAESHPPATDRRRPQDFRRSSRGR